MANEKHVRPIRNESELDRAIGEIDALLDRSDKLKDEEAAYLDALSDAVVAYEAASSVVPPSDSEMLDHLLRARGVGLQDLAMATGISPKVLAAMLSGSKLAAPHADSLANYFHVSPDVFHR